MMDYGKWGNKVVGICESCNKELWLIMGTCEDCWEEGQRFSHGPRKISTYGLVKDEDGMWDDEPDEETSGC